MVRAVIWFRCAAVHDPVRPVQTRPAAVGWAAKTRRVDLQIERGFKGDELLRRMKGWITVDPDEVLGVVGRWGRLRVLDERDLVVECRSRKDFDALKGELRARFGGEVDVEVPGEGTAVG